MYRVKTNLALVTGLIVAGVIALVSCGKKTEGPTGNSSSYPGNFLALCQSTDKTPALEKTFAALLISPTESCLDAYSRLMELDEIDLSGKGLSDIRPLASFIDLKSLYLDHNAISSAAALAGLFKLEKLDMSWNDLSSAAPLAELARLETLYLFGNPLGNDVAKTSENCPYADVGKGLKTFCTPPEPKKKRTPVVIVNKKPSSSSSKSSKSSTSSNKKTTTSDDIDDDDNASDNPKDDRPNRENDKSAKDHPQQDSQQKQQSSSKPKGEDTSDKSDDKATSQKEKRKRAWETSFVPPEDDVDDWAEDQEVSERGLTDSPAADSADADIDKAMNKEIAKSTKPEAQKPQTQSTDASTRPFSMPAPQDVAGKQTTAHSWDQAVGRVFDKTKPGAAQAQPGSAGQQEFDWDLVEGPASLDLGAELGGLGQPATSRRIPVDMEAGLTADDAAESSSAADDESTSFWSSTLLRTLGLGFKPEPEQKAQQPKAGNGKATQRAARDMAQQKPASRAQKAESVAKASMPLSRGAKARPTPKAATRIKSFLAYCLDHSGQPAIAHTIKVLTKPGETCLASYRRLAATESLDLSGKQLTDIAPLASFRNLRKLDLAHNRIGDLKPLAGLTQLTWLNIDHNGLVDIAHLGRLAALVHLTAKHNRIFSVSPLAKLSKLNTIAIKGNPIATDAAKNSSTCPKDAQSRSVQSLCQ